MIFMDIHYIDDKTHADKSIWIALGFPLDHVSMIKQQLNPGFMKI